MSTTLETSGLLTKIAVGVASASILGGGTMVLNLHRNDAVQDEKIHHIEQTVQKIDTLDDTLNLTLREIAVLNERLRQEKASEPRYE